MGAHQVDVGLGDGSHADLVIGSGEESSKCAGKSHGALTGGAADGNSDLRQQKDVSNVNSFSLRRFLQPLTNDELAIKGSDYRAGE